MTVKNWSVDRKIEKLGHAWFGEKSQVTRLYFTKPVPLVAPTMICFPCALTLEKIFGKALDGYRIKEKCSVLDPG